MKILNLGCGAKTSSNAAVTNIDWSILLRVRKNPFLRPFARLVFNGPRLERFNALPDNIVAHDLAKGIPQETASVDAVYHSHMLEHLDRNVAEDFLRECHRVLRPGGVLRVVVPDFEAICRDYMLSLEACIQSADQRYESHDLAIEPILLASVRRESEGTRKQRPWRRFWENLLLGDARRRGDTHQWMYDRFNLTALLLRCGFQDVASLTFQSSRIPGWDRIDLDKGPDGGEHKSCSIYIEAIKP